MNRITTSTKFWIVSLLTFSFLMVTSQALIGKNYYFSTLGGDDTRTSTQAQNSSTPWKSITKLNSFFSNLAAGDSILFNRGETFYGGIIVTKSGTSSLPIVISAYGTGNKPVISGFAALSSWTNEGNGIYSKTVSCESKPNIVSINGVQYGMGRYPNTGTNLIVDSHVTNVSITDADLNSYVTNWTGAEVVITKDDFTIDKCSITNHTNQTLTYTNLASNSNATNGYYYFIQNDLRTLDQFGEWYYTGSKLYMYFGSQNPSNYTVKVATINKLLYDSYFSYITLSNVAFEGANVTGIEFEGTSNFNSIKNCDVNFSGGAGIVMVGTYGLIDNSSVNNVNEAGITVNGSFFTVTNNIIKKCGVIPGGAAWGNRGMGIVPIGSDNLCQYNVIDSVGYHGIYLAGSRTNIKNNLVSNFCLILNDGGGIYVDGNTQTGRVIDGNIVLNGIGKLGLPVGTLMVEGIFLDQYSTDVVVKNNSVANCAFSGIKLHRANTATIMDNTCYNNRAGIRLQESDNANPIFNVSLTGNILVSNATQNPLMWNRVNTNSFGTADYNYYARPIDDNGSIRTSDPVNGDVDRTLANWKVYSGTDSHSQKSPLSITNPNDMRFEYNASKVKKSIVLPGTYMDVKGTFYVNSITLEPYSSVVLIKNSTYSNLPPIVLNQSFQVSENSSTGTSVGTVVATDPDAGQTLTYSILSGNTNGAFAINPSSGLITVANLNSGVGTNYSIFGSVSPSSSATNTLGNGTAPLEVGMKFSSNVDGYITGLRYYKGVGAKGTHIGNLWNSNGVKLASATFTGETASGWQTVTFTTPVAITANTTYVVSYFSPNGDYVFSGNYFTNSTVNGPLTALASTSVQRNGVYVFSATSTFPTNSYSDANYWADVIFSSTSNTTTLPSNYSVFGTVTPSSTATNTLGNGTAPLEVGMKFSSNVDGYITGLRYYKGAGAQGTHIGNLWNSSGVKLASATFTGETASGWQTVSFITPVAITANTTYVVSYFSPNGDYVFSGNYFTNSTVNGPLTALASTSVQRNGVYVFSATSTFPTNSYSDANYWADVIFSSTSNTTTLPSNYSVFGTVTPSSTATNTLGNGTAPLEVGMKFSSNVDGYITGLRYYKGAGAQGTHIGNLWNSSGVKLASATFTGETASGWQTVSFTTPVAITANTTYVVSYFSPNGDYVFSGNYFTNSTVNGPLTALASTSVQRNGVYVFSATSTFPTNSYLDANYWADVMFSSNSNSNTSSSSTTSPSSYALLVQVQDNGTGNLSSQATITININAVKMANAINIISIPLDTVSVGSNYSYEAISLGNQSSIHYDVENLPEWLYFTDNRNGTGIFEGIPNINNVGSYQIVLKGEDGENKVQQAFSIEVKANSSANSPNQMADEMHIYPNPVTNGRLNVKLDNVNEEKFDLSIYDIAGKMLIHKEYDNETLFSLDLSGYPPATYLIKIHSPTKNLTDKFIIK